jgi:hypothetical protein
MTISLPENAWNIAGDDSASGRLKRVLGGGRTVYTFMDDLSVGPLAPSRSLRGWIAGRRAFWRAIMTDAFAADFDFDRLFLRSRRSMRRPGGAGRRREGGGDRPAGEGGQSAGPRDDHAANRPLSLVPPVHVGSRLKSEFLDGVSPVVVWVGAGPSDQLLLSFLSQVTAWVGVAPPEWWLVEVPSHPATGLPVRSICELEPGDFLATARPRRVSPDEMDVRRRVWESLLGPWPEGLLRAIELASSLPHLAVALRCLVGRLPDPASGLPTWDWVMLQAAATAGPKVSDVLQAALQSAVRWQDPVNLYYLFAHLSRLGHPRLRAPLLEVDATPGDGWWEGASVRLNQAGRDVLEGRASFVTLNGLEGEAAAFDLHTVDGRMRYQRGGEVVPG